MNRLLLGSISALLAFGAIASTASAETHCELMDDTARITSSSSSMRDVRETEAFNLVTLAYRGELEEAGIPSYNRLADDYISGDITAEDVVQAAVESGYLRPAALQDEVYLSAVELQLDTFRVRR